jgi:hypothetical protein
MGGSLEKLTLGKPAGTDPTLKTSSCGPSRSSRARALRSSGATRRGTSRRTMAPRRPSAPGALIGADFLDAHLFTATHERAAGDGARKIASRA